MIDEDLNALEIALRTGDRLKAMPKRSPVRGVAFAIWACQYAGAMETLGISPCYGLGWRDLARCAPGIQKRDKKKIGGFQND